MPDNSANKENKKVVEFTYHKEERDSLKRMAEKYRCSPFTGECYTDEVSIYRDSKTGLYHILLTEKQIQEFSIYEDHVYQETSGGQGIRSKGVNMHSFLVMIKPTEEDNNYIFFRRKLEKKEKGLVRR